MTTQINNATIAHLLNNASWNYEYCSPERVKESDMGEYISELEDQDITEMDVAEAIEYTDVKEVTNEFLGQSQTDDINTYFAWHIADRVAHSKISIVYETVTFIALV